MSIYKKAPFKHVSEFANSTIDKLFAEPAFLEALEGSLAKRVYVDNAAAVAAGLKVGQLYINTTTDSITVVV